MGPVMVPTSPPGDGPPGGSDGAIFFLKNEHISGSHGSHDSHVSHGSHGATVAMLTLATIVAMVAMVAMVPMVAMLAMATMVAMVAMVAMVPMVAMLAIVAMVAVSFGSALLFCNYSIKICFQKPTLAVALQHLGNSPKPSGPFRLSYGSLPLYIGSTS